jgi:hypothetical protein
VPLFARDKLLGAADAESLRSFADAPRGIIPSPAPRPAARIILPARVTPSRLPVCDLPMWASQGVRAAGSLKREKHALARGAVRFSLFCDVVGPVLSARPMGLAKSDEHLSGSEFGAVLWHGRFWARGFFGPRAF